MKGLTTAIEKALKRLRRPGMPPDAIVSHFGVYLKYRGFDIQIMPSEKAHNSPLEGGLLITLYDGNYVWSKKYGQNINRPYSLRHQQRMRKAIVDKFGKVVLDWNMREGGNGFSVIVKHPCPPSLKRAVDNYFQLHCIPDQRHTPLFKKFDAWYGHE